MSDPLVPEKPLPRVVVEGEQIFLKVRDGWKDKQFELSLGDAMNMAQDLMAAIKGLWRR